MRDQFAKDPVSERLAALLAAAAAPAERPLPGEAEALAAYRRETASPTGPLRRRMQSRTTAKLTAVTALSAVSILGGGLAAASTGALPGAAQQTARDALARVGVTVPGPSDQAAEASATRGKSADAKAAAAAKKAEKAEKKAVSATPEATSTTPPNAHGKAVSELARTTTLSGAEKGAAVSALASGGKSRAGGEGHARGHDKAKDTKDKAQKGSATPTPTPTATSTVEGTAQRPDRGRAKAAEASGGRSGGSAATRTP
jgi:hypothetical protein